tara:strand:- start:54 stop:743 length:690 start_codon:yes stop_codon:yes gene_type:complete
MKILAIGAHPDDIEIFMFGFLCSCQQMGYKISTVIATDGSLGGNNDDNKLIENRKKESQDGLNKLGIPLFLNLPDGSLGNESIHTTIIKNSIQKVNPDLIVTHYYKDYHSDHINLSKIVKTVAGHYTPILYCDTMMGINFNPTYYIDISKFMTDKIKSIYCHKSQNPERFVKLIRLMNSYRAAQCNAPEGEYAEAYFFESSFPFSDIRSMLPKSFKIRPFHIQNINGFL